jgi:hypothetical protein
MVFDVIEGLLRRKDSIEMAVTMINTAMFI